MALKNKDRQKCLESLGLDESATEDEIKQAYKNLALQHHPDKNPDNPDATQVFQEISESYYLLITKYAMDRRRKIHMCSCCKDLHYVDSDDEDFYDDDYYFEEDDDDDDYYDDLPCDDDDESVLWFFGRLFYDVFSDFIFARRFQSKKKKSYKWSDADDEEESFFNSIFKKYRPPQDFGLTEEDLKNFHSYDEWLKARDPSKRHNLRVRKGKKKTKRKIPEKPKPPSKRQLLAEQRKREQEMKEIGQTVLPKLEKLTKKSTENMTPLLKATTNDLMEEVEDQHKENYQRQLQEEEIQQLLGAKERQKNKRQQRKDMKEKKKQLRQEAEKLLQEKAFSNPAKEREKTALECHNEKQASLFGDDEINKENVNIDSRKPKELEAKSMLLGKHLSEIGNFSSNSDKPQCSVKETPNQNSNSQSSKLSPVHLKSVEGAVGEEPENCDWNPIPHFQKRDQIKKAAQTNPMIDTEVKSSLLQKHLQEFNDLMKVQPKRHTEKQLKEERMRQKEEQQITQQRELNLLRSQHSEQFVPVLLNTVDSVRDPEAADSSVQEEFERMRKEHIRKQQELERKRNEEEAQELKTYRKKQKWVEVKVESTPKWFEREANENKVPLKVKEPPAPSVNVWQQRNLRHQQITSLGPRSALEEEETLQQVLLLSQKTAAQEEEQRRYRDIMASKNFIPVQLKEKQEVKSMPGSRKVVDSGGQKKTANSFAEVAKTSQQKNKNTTEKLENIWKPNDVMNKNHPLSGHVKLSEENETCRSRVLTRNYGNLVPPPKLHIPLKSTEEEESWDDDGEYLWVSSKLPTTARDCLRWKTNAKRIMSEKEKSNGSKNPAACALVNESKCAMKKERSSSIKRDGNHMDTKQSVLKKEGLHMSTVDSGNNPISVEQKKANDFYGSTRAENIGKPATSEHKDPLRNIDVEIKRHPWSNVIIGHQTGQPRPKAEVVWSDDNQTDQPIPSIKISISEQGVGKTSVNQNLKKEMSSPISLAESSSSEQQVADDFWNVSIKSTKKSKQARKAQKVPLLSSVDIIQSSLQQRAYQDMSSEIRTPDAVSDYWSVPSRKESNVKQEGSPSQIYISPENLTSQIEKQQTSVGGPAAVTTLPPVLSFVENKAEQTTKSIVPEGESWDDEISTVAKEVSKDSIPRKTDSNEVPPGGKSDVTQPPSKKVSSMFNKMTKFGINPNPIKKEMSSEASSSSLTPATHRDQEPIPQKPAYRRRPMKSVTKALKAPTESLPIKDKVPEGSVAAVEIVDSKVQLTKDQDNSLSSSINGTTNSLTQEKLQKPEDNEIFIGSSDPMPSINRQNSGNQRKENAQVQLENFIFPQKKQTTHITEKEDWECELTPLPCNPNPPAQSTVEAENIFKEKLRNVRKDLVEHRLPVLKNLTKRVENSVDYLSKDYDRQVPFKQTSSSEENERAATSEEIGNDHCKDKATSQQTSELKTVLHQHPASAADTMDHDIPASVNNPPYFDQTSHSLSSDTSKLSHDQDLQPIVNSTGMEQTLNSASLGLHLPSYASILTNPHAPDVTMGFNAGDPSSSTPNPDLPASLPPNLVQTYLQCLATVSNPLAGGLGMLPALPLLPGMLPLLPLGLTNTALSNPLFPINLSGLPTQAVGDPTQFVSKPLNENQQSHDQPLNENQQSHDQPCPENQQSLDQSQSENQQSYDQSHCGTQSMYHDHQLSQNQTQGLSSSQSAPQQWIKTPKPENPNTASWDFDKPLVSRRLPFNEGLNVLPSSAGDNQTSARGISTRSQFDKPVANACGQFTQEKTASSQQKSNHSISNKERNYLQNSVKTKDNSYRSGANTPPCTSETKLPESLIKRKEQTRTVQALIKHIMKENQQGKAADMFTHSNDRI
ncbi:uncharacterized protein LOC125649643 [Ostrea edulis]|uniref:uncharacterized protein LOC125649643 n=1 Tax=Ostrea edulis TaxID=37623 RepID=UPI0024AF75E0|nr:uncharacterized protein LOC125649643 [Ostrea edulis]